MRPQPGSAGQARRSELIDRQLDVIVAGGKGTGMPVGGVSYGMGARYVGYSFSRSSRGWDRRGREFRGPGARA
jgi:hypothetical protein